MQRSATPPVYRPALRSKLTGPHRTITNDDGDRAEFEDHTPFPIDPVDTSDAWLWPFLGCAFAVLIVIVLLTSYPAARLPFVAGLGGGAFIGWIRRRSARHGGLRR